jgi:two-component system, NtrC family, sensor kinase
MDEAPADEVSHGIKDDDHHNRRQKLRHIFDQIHIAKNEWEQTMDCVPEMVLLVDRNTAVRRCNKSFADFLGRNFRDIIGRNWISLFRERGLYVVEDGGPSQLVYEESSGYWFELKKHPYTAKDTDTMSRYVITVSDLTLQKKYAQQLEDKNRQILDTIKVLNEKNRELEEAYAALKASQSQVMQQERMASIGQLAAGVAHEINNPIGFITSNLNSLGKYINWLTEFIRLQRRVVQSPEDASLLEELTEKEQKLKIDFILEDIVKIIAESLDGSDRVRKIVQDLKSFSRNDDQKRIPADINECIESAVNIVWNEIKYKATLKKELGTLPRTICYPNQLNQVFMNLLMNAVHAIEKEGIITVRTWHEDGYIWASVSDTGCGIAPENLNSIFEPFFTTKEIGKGTGLGLSITYEVIKRHQGDIRVNSEPGTGTTFTVRVPVVEAP